MATRMGSPGVRIELHDNSGYSLVETPNAVAGVVGFAPKGEMNKIQRLTNTAEQDMYFGLGFNNSRYNQGMYAARAVINAGGYVEFVRPYGEEIDKTDDRKRDLKTDAYVVAFDRDAINNSLNADSTSLKMEYFAATRYKVDGAAQYGATRKINNIAETIVKNSNVDFNLDAAEDYHAKEHWTSNGGIARGETDMVLFAIMNADPSGANRAYNTFSVNNSLTDTRNRASGNLVMTCTSKVGFAVDDTVYGNMTQFGLLGKFIVTNIVDKKVTIEAADDATLKAVQMGGQPEQLIYTEGADAVNTGSDYLTVKTAVAGSGAKTFSAFQIDEAGLAKLRGTLSGTPLMFNTEDAENVFVRIETPSYIKNVTLTPGTDGGFTASISATEALSLFAGDVVVAAWNVSSSTSESTQNLKVTAVKEDPSDGSWVISLAPENPDWEPEDTTVELRNLRGNWVETINTPAIVVTDKSTVASVVDDLVGVVRGETLGFGTAPTVGDIVSSSGDELTLVPGAAIEFVPGDIVAITRASTVIGEDATYGAYNETTDAEFGKAPVLEVAMVKSSDPIANKVVLTKPLTTDIVEGQEVIGKQLINLTQTNKTVFAAKDSYTFTDSEPIALADVSIALAKDATWRLRSGSIYTADVIVTATTTDPNVATCEKVNLTAQVYQKAISSSAGGIVTEQTEAKVITCAADKDDPSKYVVTFRVVDVAAEGTPEAEPTEYADVVTNVSAIPPTTKEYADIYFVGNFTVMVPRDTQDTTTLIDIDNVVVGKKSEGTDCPFKYTAGNATDDNDVVERSEKVLTDSSIGATFVGLGLANIRYMDVNFTGKTVKVYDLTDEGEAVARLYLAVDYMYNGVHYEFDGTVTKYVHNNMQLYIGDTAELELTGSGVQFVLNDSGELDLFLEDNSYDLSGTVVGGKPSSTMTCVSFNENDPAVINNAIWSYEPQNNMNASTISTAFNLFIDKDKSDVTFFVAAGLGINNFGMRKYETLNTQVMQAILNICELRKDCFALFDGVGESRIEQALKLDSPASRFGSTLGRWGAIYDARPIFADRVVTMSNVEAAPSIAMASLITANRRGSIWWHVPAGEDTGMIPGAWCTKVKYERTFNIPEDPDSDIARLCDIHVNPFRTNKKGIYAYGDFTMQMEDTAFNAINVTMLIAGIHKMYYDYLDSKVFRLNTAALRAQITTDLQAQLDMIRTANPAGLEYGVVICDDSNNTPDVIEAHKLYVDLDLIPTSSARYITLRTNVLSRSNGNTISTEISTRAR